MKDDRRFCALIQIIALTMMVVSALVGNTVSLIIWAVVGGIWTQVKHMSTHL